MKVPIQACPERSEWIGLSGGDILPLLSKTSMLYSEKEP